MSATQNKIKKEGKETVAESSSDDTNVRSRSNVRREKKVEENERSRESSEYESEDDECVTVKSNVPLSDFVMDGMNEFKRKENKREKKLRQRKAKLLAEQEEKERMEEERKNAEKEKKKRIHDGENECENVRSMKGDRVKVGMKDVYVVCEDLTQGVKKIKKEMRDEELCKKSINEMHQDERGVNEMEVEGGAGSLDPLAEARAISKDLYRLVDDNNKVTKWMGERILNQASKYEDLIQRLLLENARLSGWLEDREKLCKVIENVTVNVKRMEKMSKRMPELSSVIERVNGVREEIGKLNENVAKVSVGLSGNATMPGNVKVKSSYAVIVRGANEELTTAEVKRRMAESVCGNVDVRMRAIKGVKGGGVIVETASESDLRLITGCQRFAHAGLRVDRPRSLDPRILIYDVQCEMTDDTLLRRMYEKSMK